MSLLVMQEGKIRVLNVSPNESHSLGATLLKLRKRFSTDRSASDVDDLFVEIKIR